MVKFLGRNLGFKPLEDIKTDRKYKTLQAIFEVIENINENTETKKRKASLLDKNLTHAIYEIQETLSKMYKRYEAHEILEEKRVKWKYASLVMDRFCFFLAIIYFIISFVSIVMSMPNLYKPF